MSDLEEIIDFSEHIQHVSFCTKCKYRYDLCSCNLSKFGDIDPEPMEIYPGLFLGSLLYLENDEWTDEKNIINTINLTEKDYDEHSLLTLKKFNTLHLPSLDIKDYPIIRENGEKTYEFTKNCLDKNQNVYIHCLMGYNRSACIICYIIWRLSNQKMKDIIKSVIEKRPCVFSNRSFIKQLLSHEKYS